MRPLALIPLVLMIAAFVLSMLIIFAGNHSGFMSNFPLLTLNTSMIGDNIFNVASNLPGELGQIAGEVQKIENEIKGGEQLVNSIVKSIAQELNIHDWYTPFMLDFCEGYYEPTPLANASFQPTMNTTNCNSSHSLYNFNITEILESELRGGVTLDMLDFPAEVDTAVAAVKIAARVMFVLYCIAAGLTGLGALCALLHFFGNGRLGAVLNFCLDLLAFLAIGIASAIATVWITKIVDAVNQYGSQIGIAAYKGTNFLILTWIATAVTLIATVLWIFDCCCGGGRHRQPRNYKV